MYVLVLSRAGCEIGLVERGVVAYVRDEGKRGTIPAEKDVGEASFSAMPRPKWLDNHGATPYSVDLNTGGGFNTRENPPPTTAQEPQEPQESTPLQLAPSHRAITRKTGRDSEHAQPARLERA